MPISRLFLVPLTAIGFSFFAISSNLPLRSLDNPNWGFKSENKDISKSLIFDQVFDDKSYLPFPDRKPVASVSDSAFNKKIGKLPLSKALSPYVLNKNWKTPKRPKRVASSSPSSLQLSPSFQNEFALKLSQSEIKTEQQTQIASTVTAPAQLPSVAPHEAKVWVLDEGAFLNGKKLAVEGAKIYWIHPNADINTASNENGEAKAPFRSLHSVRYLVSAPGYLPAVGYAVRGQVSPVFMFSENRLNPIMKSLNLDEKDSVVVGKFLDPAHQPVDNVVLDLTDPAPAQPHYALGGLFHKFSRKSGSKGLFLVSSLGPWLQYLMPTRLDEDEWSPALINLEGLPREVSLVVKNSRSKELKLSVSDSVYGTRPETSIHATLGGQRGVFIPDSKGFFTIEKYYPKSFVDLLEIKAEGYMNTWISLANQEPLMDIPLFTVPQLNSILPGVGLELNRFGTLLGRIYAKNLPIYNVDVELYDSFGQKNTEASIHYFDQKEFLKEGVLRFAVTSLPPGEWHVVIKATDTQEILSISVARSEANTISQIDF